jgi:hypothetical protein
MKSKISIEMVFGFMKRVDERQNKDNDEKIVIMEGRINDLEQYSRINYTVVIGLKTKPQSRAGPVHLGALNRIILGPCFVVDRVILPQRTRNCMHS